MNSYKGKGGISTIYVVFKWGSKTIIIRNAPKQLFQSFFNTLTSQSLMNEFYGNYRNTPYHDHPTRSDNYGLSFSPCLRCDGTPHTALAQCSCNKKWNATPYSGHNTSCTHLFYCRPEFSVQADKDSAMHSHPTLQGFMGNNINHAYTHCQSHGYVSPSFSAHYTSPRSFHSVPHCCSIEQIENMSQPIELYRNNEQLSPHECLWHCDEFQKSPWKQNFTACSPYALPRHNPYVAPVARPCHQFPYTMRASNCVPPNLNYLHMKPYSYETHETCESNSLRGDLHLLQPPNYHEYDRPSPRTCVTYGQSVSPCSEIPQKDTHSSYSRVSHSLQNNISCQKQNIQTDSSGNHKRDASSVGNEAFSGGAPNCTGCSYTTRVRCCDQELPSNDVPQQCPSKICNLNCSSKNMCSLPPISPAKRASSLSRLVSPIHTASKHFENFNAWNHPAVSQTGHQFTGTDVTSEIEICSQDQVVATRKLSKHLDKPGGSHSNNVGQQKTDAIFKNIMSDKVSLDVAKTEKYQQMSDSTYSSQFPYSKMDEIKCRPQLPLFPSTQTIRKKTDKPTLTDNELSKTSYVQAFPSDKAFVGKQSNKKSTWKPPCSSEVNKPFSTDRCLNTSRKRDKIKMDQSEKPWKETLRHTTVFESNYEKRNRSTSQQSRVNAVRFVAKRNLTEFPTLSQEVELLNVVKKPFDLLSHAMVDEYPDVQNDESPISQQTTSPQANSYASTRSVDSMSSYKNQIGDDKFKSEIKGSNKVETIKDSEPYDTQLNKFQIDFSKQDVPIDYPPPASPENSPKCTKIVLPQNEDIGKEQKKISASSFEETGKAKSENSCFSMLPQVGLEDQLENSTYQTKLCDSSVDNNCSERSQETTYWEKLHSLVHSKKNTSSLRPISRPIKDAFRMQGLPKSLCTGYYEVIPIGPLDQASAKAAAFSTRCGLPLPYVVHL